MRTLAIVLAFAPLTLADVTLAPTDGKPADPAKPLKVFILLGQSNMLGFGRVGPKDVKGSLEWFIHEKGRYKFLLDDAGKFAVRKDVRNVHVMDGRGGDPKDFEKFQDMKNDWLTAAGKSFGPELGFGWVMGQAMEEPVLVLKACIGNRGLGWDLLPPGSPQFEFEGKVYAGYKETPAVWEKGKLSEAKAVNWYAGRQYDADVAHAKAVLKNLKKYYPDSKDQGYEVAGFVWWQGHKDQSAAYAAKYEENLVRLIGALRKDFGVPNAKFVLATGCGQPGKDGFGLKIAEAQLTMNNATKYPQFVGNVQCIDNRDLWREADVSPSNQGYHYNHNAETYLETGVRLGQAMVELLKK